MKNNKAYKLFLAVILIIVFHSCIKEKKSEHKNQTNVEIQKPVDSTNSVLVETSVDPLHYSIAVEKIDSLQYYSIKKKTAPKIKKLLKITDFKEAKRLLKGVVDFDENPDFGDNPAVEKIHFRNGKKYVKSSDFDYSFFIAYFPEDDILLCEGGHSTDVSFNLKTGQETEETGNPDVFIFSPNETFRVNGSYDGQECSGYFIQEKNNGVYHKIINLEDEFKNQTSMMLCYIQDGFWTDEHTFFLKKLDFDYETGKFKFFKVKILEK